MGKLANTRSDDRDLVARIREGIKWDKRVSPADFEILAEGGFVFVRGYVDTSCKKQAALDVITTTEGVWSIEDKIVVLADFYRSDSEIQQLIESELSELVKICGEHIEVTVSDGVVKLEGEVFRPRLKAMAVINSWELSGVRDVINLIEIKDPPRRLSLAAEFSMLARASICQDDMISGEDLKEVS